MHIEFDHNNFEWRVVEGVEKAQGISFAEIGRRVEEEVGSEEALKFLSLIQEDPRRGSEILIGIYEDPGSAGKTVRELLDQSAKEASIEALTAQAEKAAA